MSIGAWLACLMLPSIALSLDAAADLSRQLRTSLVGALGQNYVVGATVHGLGRPRIVLGHALRMRWVLPWQHWDCICRGSSAEP